MSIIAVFLEFVQFCWYHLVMKLAVSAVGGVQDFMVEGVDCLGFDQSHPQKTTWGILRKLQLPGYRL